MFSTETIRQYFDSHLSVQWRGDEGTACCPFHDDDRPSLSVNAAKGAFLCHACDAQGGLIDFECQISGCDEKTAKKQIAKLMHPEIRPRLTRRIVARYPYRDENGILLFEQVRFEGKDFRFRRPNDAGGWDWNLNGVRRILYCLRSVLKAEEVFVVEGEKDVETIRSWNLVATCNPGGAGKWRDEYSACLKGKSVVILQDDDDPGHKHARQVAESVIHHAKQVKLIAPFPGAKDVTDWKKGGGTKEELLDLVKNTVVFAAEANLSSRESDGHTSQEASDLPPSDWRMQPLDGRRIVSMHEALYNAYLVFPVPELPLVLALWDIGTFLFDAFDTYPYLCITSPTKRCGKTRLAELLERLAARGYMNVNISEAALFRKIAKDQPTLILDEAETLGHHGAERTPHVLSILQAGFRKSGRVTRCVGHEHELQEFDVFCPKVVVAIGNLPDTLRDRSIVIPMKRKGKEEQTARYRLRTVAAQSEVPAHEAAMWATKHRNEVEKAYAQSNLEFFQDRECDIWEPLFAIAAVAVPDRLSDLKRAALRLSDEKLQLDVDDSLAITLVSDIRKVFAACKVRRLSTDQLISKLQMLPESHWAELSPLKLAHLLRPFKVTPRQLWLDDTNVRGYETDDFRTVFDTYLPPVRA